MWPAFTGNVFTIYPKTSTPLLLHVRAATLVFLLKYKKYSLPQVSLLTPTSNLIPLIVCFLLEFGSSLNAKTAKAKQKKLVGWLRTLWPWEPIFYNGLNFTSAITYNQFCDLPLVQTTKLYFYPLFPSLSSCQKLWWNRLKSLLIHC